MLSTANGMLATKNPAPSASTANRAGDLGMKADSVISVDHRKRSATSRRGLRIETGTQSARPLDQPGYVAGLFVLGSQCFWTNLRNFSGVVEPQTNPQSKQAKAPLVSPVPPYSVNENDRKPSGLKTAAPSSPRILPLMTRELLHFRHRSRFGSIDPAEWRRGKRV